MLECGQHMLAGVMRMDATVGLSHIDLMPYALRGMQEQDLGQVAEIERDAFPTLFPPTAFRRELKNRLAHYLVTFRRDDLREPEDVRAYAGDAGGAHRSAGFNRIIMGARSLWGRGRTDRRVGQQVITGFVGVWHMVDEAHIVSVGVRSEYRGYGIGELLLIGAIEQAMERGMRCVTLEVRISNHIAQSLYKKYGFRTMGVRKAYYTDNYEDALIMTAADIGEAEFGAEMRRLVDAHERRWGRSDRMLL